MKRYITLFAMLLMTASLMMGQDAIKKYGIKSGKITTVTEMMGQKIESPSWFDDYGARVISKASANGMEITQIIRDGKTYMVNHSAKQVQEMPTQESINYLNMDEAAIAKYKIVEDGKETVAGKECIRYKIEVSQMGQTAKMTVSVWQGFPMKMTTNTMGMDITTTITEVTECEVAASLFEIPSFK
jgi:hypothetical protein